MPILYSMGAALAKAAFTAFAKWEVEGQEAVPPRGPLIVVSNHLSNADPPMLVASIPRWLHFPAKRNLFNNPVASALLTNVGVHPVDRGKVNIEALKWNLKLLNEDQTIVLFPEGTRSRDGEIKRGMPGVAYIATKSQAPILPVAISGAENIPGFWRIAFPLCRVKVRIGEPFTLPVMEGTLSRPVLQHLTDMIMHRVASLLPQQYRGYYAAEEAGSRR